MLSLWANWLQLNSQLNSWGDSFCLYRTSLQEVDHDNLSNQNLARAFPTKQQLICAWITETNDLITVHFSKKQLHFTMFKDIV